MTIFDPAHGTVIDTGGRGISFLRLIGIGIVGFILVTLFFSSGTGRASISSIR